MDGQKPVRETRGPSAVYYSVTPLYRDQTSTIPSSVIMTATLQRANGSSQSLFWFRIVGNTGPGGVNLGN